MGNYAFGKWERKFSGFAQRNQSIGYSTEFVVFLDLGRLILEASSRLKIFKHFACWVCSPFGEN